MCINCHTALSPIFFLVSMGFKAIVLNRTVYRDQTVSRTYGTYTLHGTGTGNRTGKQMGYYILCRTVHIALEWGTDRTQLGFIQFFPFPLPLPFPVLCSVSEPLDNFQCSVNTSLYFSAHTIILMVVFATCCCTYSDTGDRGRLSSRRRHPYSIHPSHWVPGSHRFDSCSSYLRRRTECRVSIPTTLPNLH